MPRVDDSTKKVSAFMLPLWPPMRCRNHQIRMIALAIATKRVDGVHRRFAGRVYFAEPGWPGGLRGQR